MGHGWLDWIVGGVVTVLTAAFGYLFRRQDKHDERLGALEREKADEADLAKLMDDMRRDADARNGRLYDKLDAATTSLGAKLDTVTTAVHAVGERVARLEGPRRE